MTNQTLNSPLESLHGCHRLDLGGEVSFKVATMKTADISTVGAITTIHDWYMNPDSDYPRNELKRATAAMNDLRRLSQHAWDIVCEMAESCTFTTRNYGGGSFYTWAKLPGGVEVRQDPWPAARYPKAVLCLDCLMRIYESEMQRAGFRS